MRIIHSLHFLTLSAVHIAAGKADLAAKLFKTGGAFAVCSGLVSFRLLPLDLQLTCSIVRFLRKLQFALRLCWIPLLYSSLRFVDSIHGP